MSDYVLNWKDTVEMYHGADMESKESVIFSRPKMNGGKKRLIYDLYAISKHLGSVDEGHYEAHVKNYKNGKWY